MNDRGHLGCLATGVVLALVATLIALGALGCSVDGAGLADAPSAELPSPAPHPTSVVTTADAGADDVVATSADAGPSDGASPGDATGRDAPPDSCPPRSIRELAPSADSGACESCAVGATPLASQCRAALACLLTDPPYEFTSPFDPIGYCAMGSQGVAACVTRILGAVPCP